MAVVSLKISLSLYLTKRPSDLFVKIIRKNIETKQEMRCLKLIVSEESLGRALFFKIVAMQRANSFIRKAKKLGEIPRTPRY